MSEEILSEFIEELNKRSEPAPRDLIEKYARKGLPASEMAAAAMARAALLGPEVPDAAFERSAGRIDAMSEHAVGDPERIAVGPPSFRRRILLALRRLLRIEP